MALRGSEGPYLAQITELPRWSLHAKDHDLCHEGCDFGGHVHYGEVVSPLQLQFPHMTKSGGYKVNKNV